jgi:transcriptional regulator with XRE-family HTH domain
MYLNLKVQLWRRGIRQNQLARLLEMDETILSRIVNGFRPPTPEIRERIARLLEADEAWLFDNAPANGASCIDGGAEKRVL